MPPYNDGYFNCQQEIGFADSPDRQHRISIVLLSYQRSKPNGDVLGKEIMGDVYIHVFYSKLSYGSEGTILSEGGSLLYLKSGMQEVTDTGHIITDGPVTVEWLNNEEAVIGGLFVVNINDKCIAARR